MIISVPIIIFLAVFGYLVSKKYTQYSFKKEMASHDNVDVKSPGDKVSQKEKAASEIDVSAYAHRTDREKYAEALKNRDTAKCGNIKDESLKIDCQKVIDDVLIYANAVKNTSLASCDKIISSFKREACLNVVNAKLKK